MITLTQTNTLPVIQELLRCDPIIVEAGSYDGKDTQKLATTWPQATVHAFEPVPEIYELLKSNTAGYSNIHTYPYALIGESFLKQSAEYSSQILSIPFHRAHHPKKPGKPSQAGSLLKPTGRLEVSPITYPEIISVQGITLDAWAQRYRIDHVDLLWLDMQGVELDVLIACPQILKTVSVIHTEVQFIEAYEHQYTYWQVKLWLEGQGFEMIGKDFKDTTSWFFGNALFKRLF